MKWMVTLIASAAFAQPAARDAVAKAVEQQRASAARQREAILKQAAMLGVRLPPAAADPPPAGEITSTGPPCDAISEETATPLIENAAKAQEMQPRLLHAMIEQESGFHPCATSVKGAKGLMQLMPETAVELGVGDPFDPRQSVEAGARYLKQMMSRYNGDLRKALAAYNAGPATVDQAGGVPDIAETRQYVEAILRKLEAGKSVSK